MEKFKELLTDPIGFAFGLVVIMLIFSLIKFLRKNNNYRGYIVAYSPFLEKIIIFFMVVSAILASLFLVMYIFDVRATNGDTLYGHVMLFISFVYIFFSLYLFYGYKRVIFNKKEIIVKNFMRKSKTYYWEDIRKVVNRRGDKVIVITINGKFTVDNEFINVRKFLKILEEKSIRVNNINLLGK